MKIGFRKIDSACKSKVNSINNCPSLCFLIGIILILTFFVLTILTEPECCPLLCDFDKLWMKMRIASCYMVSVERFHHPWINNLSFCQRYVNFQIHLLSHSQLVEPSICVKLIVFELVSRFIINTEFFMIFFLMRFSRTLSMHPPLFNIWRA